MSGYLARKALKEAEQARNLAGSSSGGGGDIAGPASVVDERIAVFDGSTGKRLKDGGVKVADLVTAVQVYRDTDDPPDVVPDDPTVAAVCYTTNGKQYNWNTDTEEWDFFARAGENEAVLAGKYYDWSKVAASRLAGNDWLADSWRTGGGYLTNTPTGTSILADAGTFDSTVESWTALGGTLTNDSGKLKIDGGTARLAVYTGAACNPDVTQEFWYEIEFDAVANNSTPYLSIHDGNPIWQIAPGAAGVTDRRVITRWVASGAAEVRLVAGSGNWATLDNLGIKKLDLTSLIAFNRQTFTGDMQNRLVFGTGTNQGTVGLIIKCDSNTNPKNYICLQFSRDRISGGQWTLYKVLNGVPTALSITVPGIGVTAYGYSDKGSMSLSMQGTTLTATVSGVVIYSGTVNDAALTSNTHCGMLCSRDGRIISYYQNGNPATARVELYSCGSSICFAENSWHHTCLHEFLADWDGPVVKRMFHARNGYSAVVHFADMLRRSPSKDFTHFILQLSANGDWLDVGSAPLEGLIRYIRKHWPAAPIVSVIWPRYLYSGGFTLTKDNQTYLTNDFIPVMQAYGIPYIQLSDTSDRLLGDEIAWTDWYSGTDGVHPDSAKPGVYQYGAIAKDALSLLWRRGGHDMPDVGSVTPVFADATYWENHNGQWFYAAGGATPGVTETGTWTDVSGGFSDVLPAESNTLRKTTTVGSTITVNWTGRLLLMRHNTDSTVGEWRYRTDGGSWVTVPLGGTSLSEFTTLLGNGTLNPTTIPSSGSHTTEIELTSAGTNGLMIHGWVVL